MRRTGPLPITLSCLLLATSCGGDSAPSSSVEQTKRDPRYCDFWDGSPLRANEKLELFVNELSMVSFLESGDRHSSPNAHYIVVPINWDIKDQPCTLDELEVDPPQLSPPLRDPPLTPRLSSAADINTRISANEFGFHRRLDALLNLEDPESSSGQRKAPKQLRSRI